MTLYERVRKTEQLAPSRRKQKMTELQMLKARVEGLLTVDGLAVMVRDNPHRARNEVRSACRRIFDESAWAHVDATEKESLVDQLLALIFGFGVLQSYIDDESITEVIVNGPDLIFFEKDGVLSRSDRSFNDESELRALIDRILGPIGRRIDESSPMVNARLPQGHRVNVVVPPVGLDGPYVTIRKFSEHVITLAEMVQLESIEPTVRQFLIWAVRSRKSMAVSGGTGSGKTTLLNALSCEISHSERIITIEDSAELRFLEHPHVVRLEARPLNAEGAGEITIRQLVENSLRMRPDRIIVGECRGAEALDMLQAMNTGHAGSLTTLHSNSPAESISRLTTMVRFGADLPVDVIEESIASAIDLVVQTQRTMQGFRLVTQIVQFCYDRKARRCLTQPIYARAGKEEPGVWKFAPKWVDELIGEGLASEAEVYQWKRECSLMD